MDHCSVHRRNLQLAGQAQWLKNRASQPVHIAFFHRPIMQLLVDTPTAEYYAGKEMVTIETKESGGFKNAYPFVILLSTLSRAVV